MMTAEQQSETGVFQSLLWNLYGRFDPADPMQKIRARAWGRFLELGLPSRRNDVYRYIKLRSFFSHPYEAAIDSELTADQIAPHVLPECEGSVIVFVNGFFSLALSRLHSLPARVATSSIVAAARTYVGFLNSHSMKMAKEELDPFAALNSALYPEGAFLYLPPKTTVEAPIQLLHVIDAKSTQMLTMPRVQFFVGAQSQLTVISTQAVLSGEHYAVNSVVDFSIEEDAHVVYEQDNYDIGNSSWHFNALRAVLKRNSSLKTVAVTNGAGSVRDDYRVTLAGENSEVMLNGVWMLKGKKEAHTHVLVEHQAPHCRSLQLFKGALNDVSRSSFEGKILVRQAAQKTEAFQLNNNLLLSERASADSKPNLEIFADDVKASHGATVGQLDKEQIFYMKTRGFSETLAKSLLVYGFCQEVIDKMTVASVVDRLLGKVKE